MLDNIGDGLSFMGKTDGDLWLDDAACQDLPVESFFVQAGHVIDEEVLDVLTQQIKEILQMPSHIKRLKLS